MHAIALSIARAPEPNGSKAAGDLLCHPSQQGLSSAHHLPLASLHPTLAAVRRTIEQPLARPRFPKMRIGAVRQCPRRQPRGRDCGGGRCGLQQGRSFEEICGNRALSLCAWLRDARPRTLRRSAARDEPFDPRPTPSEAGRSRHHFEPIMTALPPASNIPSMPTERPGLTLSGNGWRWAPTAKSAEFGSPSVLVLVVSMVTRTKQLVIPNF